MSGVTAGAEPTLDGFTGEWLKRSMLNEFEIEGNLLLELAFGVSKPTEAITP